MWEYLKWLGVTFLILITVLINAHSVVRYLRSYIVNDRCQCTHNTDCSVWVLVQAMDDSRVWANTFILCEDPRPKNEMDFTTEENRYGFPQ